MLYMLPSELSLSLHLDWDATVNCRAGSRMATGISSRARRGWLQIHVCRTAVSWQAQLCRGAKCRQSQFGFKFPCSFPPNFGKHEALGSLEHWQGHHFCSNGVVTVALRRCQAYVAGAASSNPPSPNMSRPSHSFSNTNILEYTTTGYGLGFKLVVTVVVAAAALVVGRICLVVSQNKGTPI